MWSEANQVEVEEKNIETKRITPNRFVKYEDKGGTITDSLAKKLFGVGREMDMYLLGGK